MADNILTCEFCTAAVASGNQSCSRLGADHHIGQCCGCFHVYIFGRLLLPASGGPVWCVRNWGEGGEDHVSTKAVTFLLKVRSCCHPPLPSTGCSLTTLVDQVSHDMQAKLQCTVQCAAVLMCTCTPSLAPWLRPSLGSVGPDSRKWHERLQAVCKA